MVALPFSGPNQTLTVVFFGIFHNHPESEPSSHRHQQTKSRFPECPAGNQSRVFSRCTPLLPPLAFPRTSKPLAARLPTSLYLMEGLTTFFRRPPPPEPGLVTREALGIPLRRATDTRVAKKGDFATAEAAATAAGGVAGAGRGAPSSPSCGALYLVPQTLYKLHPDFDRLVAGVLRADLAGCAVFIRASEPSITEGLARRMESSLRAAGVAPERVVFVPRWVVSGCLRHVSAYTSRENLATRDSGIGGPSDGILVLGGKNGT